MYPNASFTTKNSKKLSDDENEINLSLNDNKNEKINIIYNYLIDMFTRKLDEYIIDKKKDIELIKNENDLENLKTEFQKYLFANLNSINILTNKILFELYEKIIDISNKKLFSNYDKNIFVEFSKYAKNFNYNTFIETLSLRFDTLDDLQKGNNTNTNTNTNTNNDNDTNMNTNTNNDTNINTNINNDNDNDNDSDTTTNTNTNNDNDNDRNSENNDNQNEQIKIPKTLYIIINSAIPILGKFYYSPDMSIKNNNLINTTNLIFNPLIKLNADYIKQIPDYEQRVAIFFNKGSYNNIVNTSYLSNTPQLSKYNLNTPTNYMQYNDNVNNNLTIVLDTIFEPGQKLFLGGKPFTILFYKLKYANSTFEENLEDIATQSKFEINNIKKTIDKQKQKLQSKIQQGGISSKNTNFSESISLQITNANDLKELYTFISKLINFHNKEFTNNTISFKNGIFYGKENVFSSNVIKNLFEGFLKKMGNDINIHNLFEHFNEKYKDLFIKII